jgi:hypothetical protein
MKKKREASAVVAETVREDYNPDEWGNIELPGISDEELHSKNWNKVTAGKYINTLPQTKQANQKMLEKRKRAGFYKKLGKRNKNNPKWLANVRAHAESKRGIKRPEVSRPFVAEGVEYAGLSEAAKAYGISNPAMGDKRERNPDAFYYKDVGPTPVQLWYYITPEGRFCNVKEMQRVTGKSNREVQGAILLNTSGYDYRLEIRDNWHEKNGGSLWKQGIKLYEKKNGKTNTRFDCDE